MSTLPAIATCPASWYCQDRGCFRPALAAPAQSKCVAENSDNLDAQAPAPKWGIEAISRATATALALTYGVGFIIVSAYEAQFGFMEFNPIRGRLFFTGFMFAILSTLPAAAFHFGFTRFVELPTWAVPRSPEVAFAQNWPACLHSYSPR